MERLNWNGRESRAVPRKGVDRQNRSVSESEASNGAQGKGMAELDGRVEERKGADWKGTESSG